MGRRCQRIDKFQLRRPTEDSRGPREVAKSGCDVINECPNDHSAKGYEEEEGVDT